MPLKTNAPPDPVRWTLNRGAREFSISVATLGSKLNDAREYAGEDECFATAQIGNAIFGSSYGERTRKLKAEAPKTELETEILRGAYLPKSELVRLFGEIVQEMKLIVRSSELDRKAQDDLLRSLASIPIRVAHVAGENPQARNGNGNGERPATGRRSS